MGCHKVWVPFVLENRKVRSTRREAPQRKRLFCAVLALWVFGLLGLFGLPPASLYLSGVVGISLGFVIRSLARWKRKRTHGTDVS